MEPITEIKKTLSVEEAAALLLEQVRPVRKWEQLPLLEAAGRICAEDVNARFDQPPFDRSPLDGYAVFHEDLAGASREKPAVLQVCQTIYAGDSCWKKIRRGEAARIMTGAPIPEGADCVVRQEDTNLGESQVSVYTSLREYQNYCLQGEDIRQGERMLRCGDRLNPAALGLLASQGIDSVKVISRPKVSVLSTGTELAKLGDSLAPGQIYDSNRILLTAYGAEQGAEIRSSVSVADEPEIIASAIQKALEESDLVVSTGGVSVGRHDYMEKAGKLAGARVLLHGVRVKPGSPVLVLEKSGKLAICLSGNPFAAFATFVLLVLPVIRRLEGSTAVLPERAAGIVKDPFPKASPVRRFVRAFIRNGEITLSGTGHASGLLASLTRCNCLIDIPAGNQGLKKGDLVETVLF
ncbi:MAG: molybdopterin molybdotransferase MoeA [Lachnospiraceae bacterium]|nr:molybdopterin molybdotransferase MoeA [Lachnospiraceae bacterium]